MIQEKRNAMTKRSYTHDYQRPGFYMITISRGAHFPYAFCHIQDNHNGKIDLNSGRGDIYPNVKRLIEMPRYYIPATLTEMCNNLTCIDPLVELTDIGTIIRFNFTNYLRDKIGLRLRKIVIMPDHIHFIIQVLSILPKQLGFYIGEIKQACIADIRAKIPSTNTFLSKGQLFSPNFNDRIIRDKEHFERERLYLENNPRRKLMRTLFPNLFSRPQFLQVGKYRM